MLSHPGLVIDVIRAAAKAVQGTTAAALVFSDDGADKKVSSSPTIEGNCLLKTIIANVRAKLLSRTEALRLARDLVPTEYVVVLIAVSIGIGQQRRAYTCAKPPSTNNSVPVT
jgi:hypothetical protein